MADTIIRTTPEAAAVAQLVREALLTTHLKEDRDFHAFALPEGWHVETLDAKKAPDAIKRDLTVIDRQSFIDYCQKWSTTRAEFRVAEAAREVLCVIDAAATSSDEGGGAPSFEDHKVTLKLQHDRHFQKWLELNDKWLDQTQLADHLEERHRDITTPAHDVKAPSGLEMYQIARQFRLSRNMQFGSAIDLTSGEVAFEYKQENKAGETVNFPEQLYLGLPVFRGGAGYEIRLRARYRVIEGKLKLGYMIMDLEKLIEDAIKAEVASIQSRFPDNLFINVP